MFFFDTSDGDRHDHDEEGQDLPDAQAARRLALETLPAMAEDRLPDGDNRIFTVSVRDARGTPIYAVELALKGGWVTAAPEDRGG